MLCGSGCSGRDCLEKVTLSISTELSESSAKASVCAICGPRVVRATLLSEACAVAAVAVATRQETAMHTATVAAPE